MEKKRKVTWMQKCIIIYNFFLFYDIELVNSLGR